MHIERRSTALLAVFAAAAGCYLLGCADPEGAYDSFADRWHPADAGPDAPPVDANGDAAPCELPAPGEAQGDYFFTMSANIAPKKPIVGLLEMTIGEGPTVSFKIQPFSAADKKTPVPGAPVIVGGPHPIAEDGSFTADLGKITVEGAANPISGSRLITTAVLAAQAGSMCKPADFVCGTVTGTVDEPINGLDLTGTTFTFQRITDPANYPEPVLNCAGDKP